MGKPLAASRPRDLAAEVLIARSPRLGPQHTCGRASGPQRTQGRALHIALRVPLPCTAPGGRAERWLWRLPGTRGLQIPGVLTGLSLRKDPHP